ncbi:MAG: tRNA uridine-5-carboxymethylaminomethyl(34) synthesis GTPase MnmE, partial [Pseudomonadota bacterium]|nr:tRNA uridine-5-carboxymethylaminomethyl(34) synthesis GTPase MnmE [Pseudomonadota bacterium]
MIPDTDTIVAVATAPGLGGIGVVRLSGQEVLSFALNLAGITPKPRYAHFCQFREVSGEVIDEGILLYFPAPYSYTGEFVLEFQGHGGPVVLNLILEQCINLGARLALPGEFTQRAFLNDRLDLVQAESVADLIEASSRQSAKASLRSLNGVFSKRINEIRDRLIDLRMFVEASIDFPEEDIGFQDKLMMREKLLGINQDLEVLLSQAQSGRRIRDGLSIVIAGPPNAGKSTLLNAFAKDDVAIVTPYSGTTRDTISETIRLGSIVLTMTDTAGIHESDDLIEQEGINRAHKAIYGADLVLWVVDASMPRQPEAIDIISSDIQVWKIYNKMDLATPNADFSDGFAISAKSGKNIANLQDRLRHFAESEDIGEGTFTAR